MEKSKKNAIVLSVVAIVMFAILIIGATYAYFQAQTGASKSTDINVTTYTTDVFTFTTGDAINIALTQSDFASGKGNATGSTFAKASLTANNKTNTATEHYYVYLNISNNSFTYSINESTPELMLTVIGPDGNEVTNIEGLAHTSVTDGKNQVISGFDVTTKDGVIAIANNKEITASPSKEEQYTIKLTFVNYDASQNANAGKSMSAKVMIQKEMIPLHESCNDNTLACHVAKLYTGTQGENSIYYHDANLTNGAGDNSYRYAGGDYVLTEAGKATGATMMIGYNKTVTTALIDFYCNGTKQYVGATCDASQAHYYLIKEDTTHYQTYKETLNKAVEKGYLTKDNVKNFVCFGSTVSPCPIENLYRIIGVFGNNVKLIKWDYAKSSLLGTDGDFSQEYSSYFSGEQGENPASNSFYYWNNSIQTNTWSESNLNKINLNTNFINNIGTGWAAKIAETTWKVGGNTWASIAGATPSVAYQNEVVNPVPGSTSSNGETESSAKVGLMYVSDYYYAAGQSAWTLVGYNSDYSKSYASAKGENWLYGGGWDWAISRDADNSYYAFFVYSDGYVDYINVDNNIGVRPSFNLESAITYVSGSGSANDPILIN